MKRGFSEDNEGASKKIYKPENNQGKPVAGFNAPVSITSAFTNFQSNEKKNSNGVNPNQGDKKVGFGKFENQSFNNSGNQNSSAPFANLPQGFSNPTGNMNPSINSNQGFKNNTNPIPQGT